VNKKSGDIDNDPVFSFFMRRVAALPAHEVDAMRAEEAIERNWGNRSIVEVTEELLRQLKK